MKVISASIVVLAGAILFSAGNPSSAEGKIAAVAGAVVGLVGLFTWASLIARRED